MDLTRFLQELSEAGGVSGREEEATVVIEKFFTSGPGKGWVTDFRRDRLGNLILRKKGEGGEKAPKIMFAAHQDEIGLIVTEVKEGFLRFSTVGGIDQRVLPGQEVLIHAREEVPGIIGATPPHLQTPDEHEQAIKIEDLVIDTGLPGEKAEEIISVGDFVSIDRKLISLKNSTVSGKALDDRAGVAVLLQIAEELQKLKHQADVYLVATVQEEVGLRGALTSAYGIIPDLGIAIDVTHGKMPGLSDEDAYELGKGPVLVIGPQVHPQLFASLQRIAEESGVKYQVEPSTRPGGTDAFALQIARAGVATALLSIPLRYMHTSVETVSLSDLREAGRLLAGFVVTVDGEFVEGLSCF